MNVNNYPAIKLFADGADQATMLALYEKSFIRGFTTNPTLLRHAGVANYRAFFKEVLTTIQTKPVSIEVFSDDFDEMERQANDIASWGANVFVKIPVLNTQNHHAYALLNRLSAANIQLNVTAVMTLGQVSGIVAALSPEVPSLISIFAGRIADTGVDPVPTMQAALQAMNALPRAELVWASTREILNITQAAEVGCHVITVTYDILKKLSLHGYDLEEYSLDTVKMFYRDARAAGFEL